MNKKRRRKAEKAELRDKALRAVCVSKEVYDTEVQADAGAHYLERNDPETPSLYSYECPVCGKWHLTSQPKRRRSPTDEI